MRASAAPTIFVLVASLVLVSGCFSYGRVGSGANDFLSDRVRTKLILEIDFQEGKQPRSTAVDLLRQRMDERLRKPDGFQVEQRSIPVSRTTWTVGDLRDAESTHRDHDTAGSTAVMYVIYVGGKFENERVLGVAYGPASMAVFKDRIEQTRPLGTIPLFSASDIERSVVVHEFGHVLGLVNYGTPMVKAHEDADHRGHSNNKDSVMYWAVDSDVVSQVFNGPPPTQFDSNDIADLRAAGGK